ncbi:hypothetical protein SUDANB120_00064 [Streptomyces sp. enrichment culture]
MPEPGRAPVTRRAVTPAPVTAAAAVPARTVRREGLPCGPGSRSGAAPTAATSPIRRAVSASSASDSSRRSPRRRAPTVHAAAGAGDGHRAATTGSRREGRGALPAGTSGRAQRRRAAVAAGPARCRGQRTGHARWRRRPGPRRGRRARRAHRQVGFFVHDPEVGTGRVPVEEGVPPGHGEHRQGADSRGCRWLAARAARAQGPRQRPVVPYSGRETFGAYRPGRAARRDAGQAAGWRSGALRVFTPTATSASPPTVMPT